MCSLCAHVINDVEAEAHPGAGAQVHVFASVDHPMDRLQRVGRVHACYPQQLQGFGVIFEYANALSVQVVHHGLCCVHPCPDPYDNAIDYAGGWCQGCADVTTGTTVWTYWHGGAAWCLIPMYVRVWFHTCRLDMTSTYVKHPGVVIHPGGCTCAIHRMCICLYCTCYTGGAAVCQDV